MTWWAAGTLAVSTVGQGLLSASAANKQKGANYINQLNQQAATWTQNIADNEAIEEANLQNTIRTGYRAGILNMQRGQAKQAAIESGLTLNRSATLAASASTANSFAAGTMGPSVDAAMADIQQKRDEAQNQINSDYLIQETNFDLQMHDILTAGSDAIQSARKVSVTEAAAPSYTGIGETLLSSGLQLLGSYASQRMSLNLGTKPANGGKPSNEVF